MISRIRYHWGMSERPLDIESLHRLKSIEWVTPDIPEEVLTSAEKEGVLEFVGECGDPEWGDPTEIDCLEIDTDRQTTVITIYNRGILLMSTDSEDVKRLHRFCFVLQKAAG
jgi:hypothetical protein